MSKTLLHRCLAMSAGFTHDQLSRRKRAAARTETEESGEVIISETTIATVVLADAASDLAMIARSTAVTLALAATGVVPESTLVTMARPARAIRATVLGWHPEPTSVAVTVTPLSQETVEPGQVRVLTSAQIVVVTPAVHISQQVTNTLLASLPNWTLKPLVVIRAPRSRLASEPEDRDVWRERHAWRRARG